MNGTWLGPGLGLAGSVIVGLGMAASYGVMEASSTSPFCGTCHVMKSYHASWSESTHNKVACVECHIPSGLGPTIQKKLDGLAMLAKTLSGEVSSHISAHVADDVCLRCHERRLLVGQEWFDSVLFDHRPHLTKLRRGVQLNCSSCHSQIVQGDHITVTSSSCLVCHFLNRPAGAVESECALCHQVDGLVAERGGRAFDHSRAVEFGIDCESCHEPMPAEASAVPRERCLTCHNRPERLKGAENPQALMEAHLGQSRAQCADCHREVRHVGKRREGSDLSRCEGCHRPRITPQLVLYAGLDQGSVGPMVSPMYRAGVRCQACHVERSGMIAKPVDSVSCLECHPLGIERLYEWWRDAIEERQTAARRMLTKTSAELGENVAAVLREADREIELVEKGGGVHNLELAMSLLDSAANRIAGTRSRAGLAPLELPWKQARVDSSCHRCHLGTESEAMTSFGRDFGHAVHVIEGDVECRKCHSEHEARRRGPTSALLLSEPECQGCHHEQIETESCSSCHEDLHRAEFANARCNECHVADFWSPAPGFDHQESAYPLTGAHRDVACAECHLERDPGGNQLVRYQGLEYRRCQNCHEDPHAVELGPRCEDCHVTESWRMEDRDALDHAKTRYALDGLHEKVECESCHPAGRPLRIENHETCAVCHRDDHLGQFAALEQGSECEPCHSVSGFLPTLYSPEHHDRSAFPLRGAHLAVPCNDCHQKTPVSELPTLVLASDAELPETTVQFRFASTECADCHDDPHSGSTDEFMQERGCESCHGEESWTLIAFDHRLESFALEGKHRDVACIECHPRLPEGEEQCVQLRGVPVSCAGCHENPHLASATSASRTTDCERCHNADDWTSTPFEHRRDTRFPLIAAHLETACTGCHLDSRYEQASPECRDCHVDPHRGELGMACDRCHTPHSWTYNVEALTTHSATLFPLDGAHSTLDCAGCHDQAAPFEFSSTPTDCASCHETQYRDAVDPNHLLLGLPTDCSDCHDSRSWTGATIADSVELDHDLVFGLTGAHRGLDCVACHQSGYAGTARDCMGCHRSDYERTREPNHALAALPGDCTLCHTSESWFGATFAHEASYPLEGAHRGLDCTACHTASYTGTSSDCLACHQQDLLGAEPDHAAAGFDTDCATCHDQRDWGRAEFDHSTLWPLTGGHRKLECAACHSEGYANTSSDCYACHRRDYRRVEDPDHRAAGLGRSCEDCHGTRSWSGASLDHDEVFYLGGAHRNLECEECHAAGYTGTPRDCYACHQSDYAGVRDPNHRAAGYSTQCTDCHGTKSWSDVELDHGPVFPLTGAHREADCAACHAGGYAGTPADCVSCHRSDYDRARNPDHRTAGLATDCLECHSTSGWSNAAFDHGSASFELTGAHKRVDCDSCHARGYAGTSPECASCHQGEYDAARDPDHRKSSLPNDCALCHTTEDWRDTLFAHENVFRLAGAHAEADCVACHARAYAGTPRYCSACHQAEYEATRNPDHRAAGFATDCAACHDPGGWQGASLDHELYYSLTGAHTRLDCASCHAGGFAGTPRDCAGCHLDEFEATVDPDHRSAGFPRDCTYCHDTERWPGTSFVHDTFYPLTGFHTLLTCTRCHSETFAGTPRECAGCHLDKYLETKNPDHEAAQFSHNCESCHSSVAWYGAMFREHDTLHFPIYQGAHEDRWGSCKTCHRLVGDYQSYSCTICHNHRRDKMDRIHALVPGYEFLNESCYSCHPTGEVL